MHMIGIFVIIGAIIAAVWFVQGSGRTHTDKAWPRVEWSSPRSPALDLLEKRYARGEIDRKEYLEKKSDLAK